MTEVNRQAVIESLKGFGRKSAAEKLGMTPAQYVVHRLSTWAKRNGKPLSPNQQWVLDCCRKASGQMPADEAQL